MANVYKINADGLRIPVVAADPVTLENGMIWYNSTDNVFRRYENGMSTELGGSPDFSDASFRISDDGDSTKKVAFEVSGVATATTRTITVPDSNVDLGKVATAVQADGSVAFTADQSMGNHKLTNLLDPTGPTDAANKSYVDAISAGLDPKASVRAATTAALAASTYVNGTGGVGATLTANSNGLISAIDGITLATGNRLLVKDQASTLQNGIYTVTSLGSGGTPWVLTRATDQDGSPSNEVSGGNYTFVEQGTVNNGSGFVVIFDGNIVVGTDPIVWSRYSGAGQIIAGAALTKTGNQLDVNVDNSTIEVATDALQVKDGGITNAKIASGVDAVKIADGSVSNAEFQRLDGVTSPIQGQIDAKVTGPASAVDKTLPRYDGTTGKLIQGSGVTVDNSNNVSGFGVLVHGANGMQSGPNTTDFYETQYIHSTTLTASQTSTVASNFTFAFASFEGMMVEYKIKEATTNRVRVGTLYIGTNGTTNSITDTFTETGDVGVLWDLNINGANIELRYTTTANNKTMRAIAKRIKT